MLSLASQTQCQCLSSLILVWKIRQVPRFRLLPQILQIPKKLKKDKDKFM